MKSFREFCFFKLIEEVRFVKNFEREQIRVSIRKGRFEMENVELDEEVLMDLVELPAWLRVNKITCNRLYVKIGWRNIQTKPVHVYLDQVRVILVTCPELRKAESSNNLAGMPNLPLMKYRLPHEIIDGTYLTINSLHINFNTGFAHINIQLQHLRFYASTPEWQEADVIRHGRLEMPELDQVLLFRQVDFESLNVQLVSSEASDINQDHLIANAVNLRIIIKRRLSDASVVCVKLDSLLDLVEIVLNESQVKLTVDLLRDLLRLSEAAAAQTQTHKAQTKYTVQIQAEEAHPGQECRAQMNKCPHLRDPVADRYMRYNIWETSYHLLIRSIDVTIVHAGNQSEMSTDTCMTLRAENVRLSRCPFRLETAGYENCMISQRDMPVGCSEWIGATLAGYKRELGSLHSAAFQEDVKSLMSTLVVASVGNLFVWPVRPVVAGRATPFQMLPFLSFAKDQFELPESLPVIHLVHTWYYYAKHVHWPVPKADMFISISPMKLAPDQKTVNWLCSISMQFAPQLIQSLNSLEKYMKQGPLEPSAIRTLIRLEVHFPEISLRGQCDSGPGVVIQASSIVVTNTSVGQTVTVNEAVANLLQSGSFTHPNVFPDVTLDWSLPDLLQHFLSYSNTAARTPSMMRIEIADLWAGIVNDDESVPLPLPPSYFLDAFSLRVWLIPGSFSISKTPNLLWTAALIQLDSPIVRLHFDQFVLEMLGILWDGVRALGQLGLSVLDCPRLGLCLLMHQEHLELSFMVKEDPESRTGFESSTDSDFHTANDSDSDSVSGTSEKTYLNVPPSLSTINNNKLDSASARQRSSLTGSIGSTVTSVSRSSISDQFWWRRSKYYKSEGDSDQEIEETESRFDESLVAEPSLVSDFEDVDWSDANGMNRERIGSASFATFSWSKVGEKQEQRRVPLLGPLPEHFYLMLRSIDASVIISLGHILAKIHLARVEVSEPQDHTVSTAIGGVFQENSVGPKQLAAVDTLVLRFEDGKCSGQGVPAVRALLRHFDLKLRATSVRLLAAMFSGTEICQWPAEAVTFSFDVPVTIPPVKLLKLLSDVNITDTQLRKTTDAAELVEGCWQVNDLALCGLAVQWSASGDPTVNSLAQKDDNDDEDHIESRRLIQRQLTLLRKRKAVIELQIGELESQLESKTTGWY